ncbi:hypothetical protein DSO57_1039380 [Entomophthora muscae]|uniref:Uncharacterized protein n=1 Tax=Entomophthora muscae TaxID=34485 RepID=A0ACC2SB63_9FUNG|nr:hypothetical protein DSO57_1039380 [Entomophthora muscae]
MAVFWTFRRCSIVFSDVLGILTISAFVTEVTLLNPITGFEPTPSHQAGGAGSRSLLAPGFALKSKYPGVRTTPDLSVAAGLILGPKSYAKALVGLIGPGKAKFIAAQNFQFKSTLYLECLSSQSQNGNQIGKDPMTPAAKPDRTNDQSGKDRPPASQATFPEDPKNDNEAANQPEEFEMPSLFTQIAPE